MDIKGKVAIVTGGGTGIGRATTLMLAERGANVVINYSRSESDAEATLADVKQRGADGMIFKADVSKDAQVREMVKKTLERFGRVDIVVNNAGTTNHVALPDLEGLKEEYWDNAFNVNVKGHFFVSRACAGELKKNKGCIVNVCSISGITGRGSSIAYCASKAAIIGLTRDLAQQWTGRKGIRVNAVAPGFFPTEMTMAYPHRYLETVVEQRVPAGRPGDLEECAAAVLFLASEAASYVTGILLPVDGGLLTT